MNILFDQPMLSQRAYSVCAQSRFIVLTSCVRFSCRHLLFLASNSQYFSLCHGQRALLFTKSWYLQSLFSKIIFVSCERRKWIIRLGFFLSIGPSEDCVWLTTNPSRMYCLAFWTVAFIFCWILITTVVPPQMIGLEKKLAKEITPAVKLFYLSYLALQSCWLDQSEIVFPFFMFQMQVWLGFRNAIRSLKSSEDFELSQSMRVI